MNTLSTVNIRRPLTGYIGTDSNIIPTKEVISATSLKLPNADLKKLSKSESMLYTATSGPLDMLINGILGRTKMLKKQIELQKTTQLSQSLLDKYPETYFTSVLKIDRFKIYSFIFFCEDDPNYKSILKSTGEDIRAFLERKSVEFRERQEED